jgi:hypothetical protein
MTLTVLTTLAFRVHLYCMSALCYGAELRTEGLPGLSCPWQGLASAGSDMTGNIIYQLASLVSAVHTAVQHCSWASTSARHTRPSRRTIQVTVDDDTYHVDSIGPENERASRLEG